MPTKKISALKKLMFEVRAYEGLNRTPALGLALDGWVAMRKMNVVDQGAIMLVWDHNALVAFRNEEPIGVLTYSDTKWLKQYDIGIGYVEPPFRGVGVYSTLWNELIKKATAAGYHRIASSTHVDNIKMREVAAKQGRTTTGVILSYDF